MSNENKIPKDAQADMESAATEAKSEKTLIDKIIWLISIAFACFFLYTAFKGPFVSSVQRGVHVCGGIAIWALRDLVYNKKDKSKINKTTLLYKYVKLPKLSDGYIFKKA